MRAPEAFAADRNLSPGLAILLACVCVLAGAGSSLLIEKQVISPPALIIGAAAFFLLLVAALTILDAAVFTVFALLGFVRLEPSPSDVLAIFLLVFLLLTEWRRHKDLRSPLLIHVAIFVFLASNFTALHLVREQGTALRYAAISLYLVAFFYFIRLYARDGRATRVILGGYLAAAGISALVGLMGLFNIGIGDSAILYSGKRWDGYFRIQGLFKDPNVFGPFLIPALLMLVEDLRRPWFLPFPRFVKAALALLVSLAVILSFSRAGFLNLGFAVLVYLLVLMRTEQLRYLIATTLLAVAVVSIPLLLLNQASGAFGLNTEKAKNLTFSIHAYDTERFEAQKAAMKVAYDEPFGIGPGQYSVYFPVATHALYQRLLAEQGWLGLAAILVLILVAIRQLIQVLRFSEDVFERSVATVLLASLAGLLVNSFFIDTLHWRHLWLLLGLSWAIRGVSILEKP